MRIACSRCQTQYEIPDEKLARGVVKVRCSECGHVFGVRKRAEKAGSGPEMPPPEAEPAAAAEAAAPEPSAGPALADQDVAGGPEPPAEAEVPPSEPEPPAAQPFADLDFGDFADRSEEAEVTPPTPESDAPAAQPFGDLDLGDFAGEPEPPAEAEAAPPGSEMQAESEPAPSTEARFEDFDFESFGNEETPAEPPPTESRDDLELPEEEDDVLASLGKLDLGEFDDLEAGLDLSDSGEEADGYLREPEEPLEQVRSEELVSSRGRGEVEVQGLAEEIPRLDIQRGPRRPEKGTPSPLIARDRRRSPLFWVVLVAAFGTATYTAYNLYLHPEAFTFFSPSKIRALWHARQMEAQLAVEELRGYYRDLPGGRQVFVIQGGVANKSAGPRSLIRVRGNLFDAAGKTVASREVYCGNVLTETELATLPMETVQARLQNEVGQTLSNVDIAPGSRVPFMVVFPSPPEGVEKFNVAVTEARHGSGS